MVELKEVFTNIYESNLWTSEESRSGLGSELKSTEVIRRELPELFKKFKIESVLDIPCGDFNWMQHVDMNNINYIGADIVDKMIESNNITFPNMDFRVLDLTESELPKVDLIFVRDLLGHFNYQNVNKALQNIIRSGSKYLLTTSFTRWHYNVDIENGGWRPINLMLQPFSLKPIYLINEDCFEGDGQYNDKCLLLFEIKRLFCGI
jgi:SAM-dependent methyltransferase